jgi:Transcriptional regulator containing PAS, AAA-type ATPase, and DNA-binding domains
VVINFSNVIDGEIVSRVLGLTADQKAAINPNTGTLKAATESLERQLIQESMAKHDSKRKAAAALGIDHSTLIKKCKRLGID